MALKTFVKISNVSSLSDARYCAGMMVDVLGFNIDPTTEDFVSEGDFGEITDWVAGAQFAGEFHSAGIEQIKEALRRYQVDLVEISQLELVEPVQLLGKSIIFREVIDNQEQLSQLKADLSYLDELAVYVIINCDNPELFNDLDAQIGYYNGNLKLLKGFGIEENDHLDKFPGLALSATKEERPGYKDYGQIMDVLEVLEEN